MTSFERAAREAGRPWVTADFKPATLAEALYALAVDAAAAVAFTADPQQAWMRAQEAAAIIHGATGEGNE